VACTDGDGNVLVYFGVIEDIIKISWEGREQLDLILFYCRWFDPTSRGVRRTENLGLVEVKHSSRLQNFEPFVLASQVTQVYYLSYPCVDKPCLRDWWVVYHVAPRDCLPPIDTNNCNEHGTIYAISSDFSDRMTTQSMGLMVLLSEHF
jgi:hypothetical protein